MPLAVVIRSGTTPSRSQANQSPVRQKPVWISSAMKTMPLSEHQAATAGRKPAAGTTKPPSPWIGSMMTAATFSVPTWTAIWLIARAAAAAPSTPASRNG
jgi:hypothetical protein